MAAAAAAFVGPVTDAAAAPIAFNRSPACNAVRNVPGVCSVVTMGVTAVCDEERADDRAVDDLIAQEAGDQPAGRNRRGGQPDVLRHGGW